MLFTFASIVVFCAAQASATAVFAHFMVGNTAGYNYLTWGVDIGLAKTALIDAFALNIAQGEPHNDVQLALAFQAAQAVNFKLFFSFDYAGGGLWARGNVQNLLNQYRNHPAYYKEDGLPLVSTFEGWQQSQDWQILKQSIPMIFVPDWSSLGAIDADIVGRGIIDGLFNWAAWPNIDNGVSFDHESGAMDTYTDASYLVRLQNHLPLPLEYMMPISPWFYTNMPGFGKNWRWGGTEALWYQRWEQILDLRPRWVQVISWNDYGESHYIGPLRGPESMIAFESEWGNAPYNYANNRPHDGWRSFLPFFIQRYKAGGQNTVVTREGLTAWWLTDTAAMPCDAGNTTTNTATHLQLEHDSFASRTEGVFFTALLGSPAQVPEVRIGGVEIPAFWNYIPHGFVGVWRGTALTDRQGHVSVTLRREGNLIGSVASASSDEAIGVCISNYHNYNPVVKSAEAANTISSPTPQTLNQQQCMEGTGKGAFKDLCKYTCERGYCPITACVCTRRGIPLTGVRGPPGYARYDRNFAGLCAVACSYGSCPSAHCDMVERELPSTSDSPFTPPSCRVGTGPGPLKALCEFGCTYGHCPKHAGCVCSEEGPLRPLPAATNLRPGRYDYNLAVRLLCDFACKFGHCKEDGICNELTANPFPNTFLIYTGSEGGGGGLFPLTWFHRSFPSCADVTAQSNNTSGHYNILVWDDASDLEGVVCEPVPHHACGASGVNPGMDDPNNIERFEVNLHAGTWPQPSHFTIYKTRGFRMYDVQDQVVGQCYPERDDELGPCIAGIAAAISSIKWFRCKTSLGLWGPR